MSTPTQPLSLNIQDIQNLLVVIDLAAQRGAFRAAELSHIGSIFDKINGIIQPLIENNSTAESQQTTFSAPFTPTIGN